MSVLSHLIWSTSTESHVRKHIKVTHFSNHPAISRQVNVQHMPYHLNYFVTLVYFAFFIKPESFILCKMFVYINSSVSYSKRHSAHYIKTWFKQTLVHQLYIQTE